jgi:hypothetical protein
VWDYQRLGLGVRCAMRYGIAEQVKDRVPQFHGILRVEDSRDRCRPNT